MTARILICTAPRVWSPLPADHNEARALLKRADADTVTPIVDVLLEDLGDPRSVAPSGAGAWPALRAYTFADRIRRTLGVWCCVLLIQAEPRPLDPSPSTEPA